MNQRSTSFRQVAKTIDEVLLQLDEIIQQSVEENNFLCTFAYVYRRTTAEVKKAIESGRFDDPVLMEKLDVTFANLYIEAYHKFRNAVNPSKSWQFAFESGENNLAIIQHILLGMNAHINLDLSVAAASITRGEEIIQLKNDFMTINQILAELTQTIQRGLGKASIMMKLLDLFGFRSDEKIINFSIKKARDFAWINALELALLHESARNVRIEEIDKRVVELSKLIKNPPGKFLSVVLKVISWFEVSDKKKLIDKMQID